MDLLPFSPWRVTLSLDKAVLSAGLWCSLCVVWLLPWLVWLSSSRQASEISIFRRCSHQVIWSIWWAAARIQVGPWSSYARYITLWADLLHLRLLPCLCRTATLFCPSAALEEEQGGVFRAFGGGKGAFPAIWKAYKLHYYLACKSALKKRCSSAFSVAYCSVSNRKQCI